LRCCVAVPVAVHQKITIVYKHTFKLLRGSQFLMKSKLLGIVSALSLFALYGCSTAPSPSVSLWGEEEGADTQNLWSEVQQKSGEAQQDFQETWDKNLEATKRDITDAQDKIYAQTIPFDLPTGIGFSLPEFAAPESDRPAPSEQPPTNQVTDQVIKVYAGGAGSGVVVGSDGQIVTNAHVLADRSSINVVANGQTYPAQIVRVDDGIDLALIQIDAVTTNPATFGTAQVGEPVTTIGNPRDKGITEKHGSIYSSAPCLIAQDPDGKLYTGLNEAGIKCQFTPPGMIQPGNSGGGAFNQYGELIGITNAQTVQGYGSIIPGAVVESFLQQ
jgi:S1-C subfamily serine protease